MTNAPPSPLDLLEPGALLAGPLARSLAAALDRGERLPPGTRLGPFRIEGELGAGGMGVVYRAERADGEFAQSVALKCVARHGGDRGDAMFVRERQILAGLRHPNIARLLDGGRTADGRLWFAMEHVDGARIDLHARTQALGIDERLRLLTEVADAVGFAHGRLLVHRDIEPANVLVDGDGRAKLLDFGIATLAGDDGAARAYSPAWASPEQIAGEDVGPASDQFQLGRLLDALLRADSKSTTGSTETRVLSGDTRPVDGDGGGGSNANGIALDPQCWLPVPVARRAELADIVRRSTARRPADRYGSVTEFADDLRRWLARQPVQAHAGGIAYTLRCAVRRHPLVTLGTVLAGLGLVAVIATFSIRLATERDHARAAATRAERETATAQAINQFLREDLIRAADPYGENAGDIPIGTLIEKAIPRVKERLARQPEVAGEVYLTLGRTLLNLGRTEPAAAALDLAVEQLGQALGPRDVRVLGARLQRAEVDEYAARYEVLLAALEQLRADAAVLGESHVLVLQIDRARAWQAYIVGDFERAATGFADVRERAAGNPALGDNDRAIIEGGLSLALSRLSRFPEALAAADTALRLRTAALGPEHPETLAVGFQRTTALVGLERVDEAVATLDDLHRRFKARFGDNHAQTIIAAHELGVNLGRLERYAEAVAPLREAVQAKSAVFGAATGTTMNSMAQLALVELRSGDPDAAARTVAAIWAGGYSARNDYDRRSEANLRRMMGELALAQGDPARALADCRLAREGAARYMPPGHFAILQADACLALAEFSRAPTPPSRATLIDVRTALATRPHTVNWLERIDRALTRGPTAL